MTFLSYIVYGYSFFRGHSVHVYSFV